MTLFQVLKTIIEAVVNIPLFISLNRPHAKPVLLLSPQYLNYGDHLIAHAEMEYLRSKFPQKRVLDLNYTFFSLWDKRSQRAIRKDDIVFVTGGGYTGDLWPESQAMIERVISSFPRNMIVFAPMTAFFHSIASDCAQNFIKMVQDHGKCVFFAREKNTQKVLQEMGIPSFLFPDFGILTPYEAKKKIPVQYAALCLRDDRESCLSINDQNKISKAIQSANLPIHRIMMAKNHMEIPAWCRQFFLNLKMKEYMKASVVITDRLHSMVFCAITGTPCVAMDNVSHKISGVYEWFHTLPYIQVIGRIDKAESSLRNVLVYRDKDNNRAMFQKLQSSLIESYIPLMDHYITR